MKQLNYLYKSLWGLRQKHRISQYLCKCSFLLLAFMIITQTAFSQYTYSPSGYACGSNNGNLIRFRVLNYTGNEFTFQITPTNSSCGSGGNFGSNGTVYIYEGLPSTFNSHIAASNYSSSQTATYAVVDIGNISASTDYYAAIIGNCSGNGFCYAGPITITPDAPTTGEIQTFISPNAAVNAGAQWRIANLNSPWYDDEESVIVESGTYTIEFKNISGWETPSDATVFVSVGEFQNVSRTYTQNITYSISGYVTNGCGGGGIGGATVTFANNYSDATSSSGYYSITGIPAQTSGYLVPSLSGNSFQPSQTYIQSISSNLSNRNFATEYANIQVSTASLNFGDVEVGQNSTLPLTITNNGNSELSISNISGVSGFSLQWTNDVINASNGHLNNVTFSPNSEGSFSGTLYIQSDACNNSLLPVAVSGQGIPSSTITVSSVVPLEATLNQPTTFTVTGTNLTSDIAFFLGECANLVPLPNGTSTQRQFECTPSFTTGLKDGVVKDMPNGTTLHEFQVNVLEGTCYFSDIVGTDIEWANEAAVYLCENGVLDDDDDLAEPADTLNRAALAKMLYYANDLNENDYVTNTVQYFPSPFYDLQEDIWYRKFALALSYLEYDGDCISVFDRNYFNFKPSNPIERRFVLKALLEAWNITLVTGTDLPFTDVSADDPAYDYIYTAWTNGIIQGDANENDTFRPSDYAIRAESFVMIYNMMTTYGLKIPTEDDFYTPGNYTPANMASAGGSHSGNFNFYSKTSFAIPSVGMPLAFGHTYNSYLSDLPKEFFAMQPLGNGWSHSFNMYLMDVQGDEFGETNDNRIVILLPSGGIYVFKDNNGTYETETKGIYATLTKVNANTFQFLTKDHITYTFEKQTGTHDEFPYTLVQIKDRNNNIVSLTYEAAMATEEVRLKEVLGTAGRKLRFYYHISSDLLQRVNDPINRNIWYNYSVQANGLEQLTTFINAKGDNAHYNYGTDACTGNLLYSIQLPKGNTVTVGYDEKKMNSVATNGSTPTTYSYNFNYANGNRSVLMNTSNPTAGNTSTTYNGLAQPTVMSGPGFNGTVDYNTANQPTVPSAMTINNRSASYTYDAMGNVLQINLPESVTHKYTYNGFNDVLTYTNPNNKIYNFAYTNGNLTSSKPPGRGTTQYGRNSNGTLASVTTPSNITVTYGYDNYGNVNSTSAPMGINTSATYDNASRLLTSTNPNGQQTIYTYDNNDNLLTHSFSGTTTYTYDENDNLLTVKNANDGVTSMMYDENLDFLKQVKFGDFEDNYTYYNDGRLETKTDPNGNTFTYAYDNLKRLESIVSANDNVQYNYDAQNNIESVQNNSGTIQLTYDNLNRLETTTDFYGHTVAYTYDPASNIKSIAYTNTKTVHYDYYDDNLLKSVKDWNNNTIATYTYRSDGLLETITYGNGTTCTYSYDAAGRNEGHTWTDNSNNTICSYSRSFDNYGNIISETANEPLAAVIPPSLDINSTYDAVNRQETFGATNFDFADKGTLNSKGTNNYTFDDYDRLTNLAGTNSFAYTYDGMGNRRQSVKDGTTTRYILSINGMSQVLVETNGSNTPTAYYIYGLGLAARILPDGTIHYYHGDYRSSTIAMTDADGVMTHKYAYGPYGELWASEKPEGEEDLNPFRYVGGQGVQYESDNLYFMRARYYDTEVGRFLSEDPIWAVNLYGYAGENPINNLDPNGLSWVSRTKNELLNTFIPLREDFMNEGNDNNGRFAAKAWGEALGDNAGITGLVTDSYFSLIDARKGDYQGIAELVTTAALLGTVTGIAGSLTAAGLPGIIIVHTGAKTVGNIYEMGKMAIEWYELNQRMKKNAIAMEKFHNKQDAMKHMNAYKNGQIKELDIEYLRSLNVQGLPPSIIYGQFR